MISSRACGGMMMAVRVEVGVRIGVATLVVLAACGAAQSQSCMPLADHVKQDVKVAAVISAAGLRVPEKAWRHYGKAVEAARAQRSEVAEQEITKALAIAPAFADPYVLRAVEEVGAGQFAAAIEDALAAQRIDPRAVWAGVVLAGAYNGTRRYREAAATVANMPKVEADTWQATYEMTRAVVGMGDVAEALRWSAMTLKAAPASCMDAHILRGDAFLLAHRWSDAVAQLTLYVDSPQPQLQHHRAEVLKVLEQTKRRVQEAELSNVASAGDPIP